MFERLCMAQRLRALIQQHSLPTSLAKLIQAFRKRYNLLPRGTLLNDVLAFETPVDDTIIPSSQVAMLSQPILLDPDVRSMLQQHYESTLRISSQVPAAAFSQRAYVMGGVTYNPAYWSPRNSNVAIGTDIPRDWAACRIENILVHTLGSSSSSEATRTFFVVRRYKELDQEDCRHDTYRGFQIAGGRAYYADLQEHVELIEPSRILCHFALTPITLPNVQQKCIHALPLDRDVCSSSVAGYSELTRNLASSSS